MPMFDPTTVNFPWEPVDDRVVVLPLLQATPSAEGSAGLVLTDQNRERPMIGIVLVAGPGGVAPETGYPVAVNSTAGQLVAFGRYAGLDFEAATPAGHLKVLIMRDCDALLRRPAGSYELVVHEDNPAKMHEAGYVCDLCRPAPEPIVLEAAQPDETPAAVVDPEVEQAAGATIAAERERLRLEREARDANVGAPSPFTAAAD
jgi:co-chaperonin GroES (HSP10)